MAVKGLDNWKNIKDVGSAEKAHQQNERAREQDRDLDKRLQHAFENFKAKPVPAKKQGGKLQQGPEAASLSGKSLPKSQLPKDANLVHGPRSTVQQQAQAAQISAEGKRGVEPGPKIPASTVYQQPADPSTSVKKNMPEAQQASHFVGAAPRPNLAHLLKSIPPTPPKTEDGKQPAKANPNGEILQPAKEAAKIQAPITPDTGGKLADAAKRQGDLEVGKRKVGEKKEGTERSEGRGALAAGGSGSAGNGGRLEAASSGIAQGQGEPVWIADLEPLGYTMNLDRDLKKIEEVRKRADWYRKYVEQPKFAEVMAKGVQLSHELDDLFDQVKKNIPPKNSYGVVRG